MRIKTAECISITTSYWGYNTIHTKRSKMKVEIKYMLITDLLGERPNGRCPESFNSVEEATQHWRIHYENRNKKDGYDEYWRKTPLRIQQIITTNLWEN